MNDQADNPYAAPQAPPEEKPPVPRWVYLWASFIGAAMFAAWFTIVAVVSTLLLILANAWYGQLDPEAVKIVRLGALASCVLGGVPLSVVAARSEFRRRIGSQRQGDSRPR